MSTLVRDATEPTPLAARSGAHEAGRRRFTIAALGGLGVAAVPYLWVLWDGRIDPLRRIGYATTFYDAQARALGQGHWWVPKGSLGIEAFVIHGRHYTYFGPFPALLRMPILALTDSLDGRLTAPSMLLAWGVTATFSALLLWRVRVLMRGSAPLGRAESGAFGVLLAVTMGGSSLLFLASLPWVFHEAIAWGVAFMLGSCFALLGVIERPSTGRVVLAGALILGAVLSRSTVGYACVIGALLAAAWLASGRLGARQQRWWFPVLVTGLLPLAVGCAVAWAKFGGPFTLPYGAQTFPRLAEHRRLFLAANGGKAFRINFLPTTLWTYLRPDALRVSSTFPFITLPSGPPPLVGGVVFDMRYRTTSVAASMPLLFALGCWGGVTAFRRQPVAQTRLTRIPLLTAVASLAGILLIGFLTNRYVAEFVPVLVVAGSVGLVDVWRRLEGRGRRIRAGVLVAIIGLALFCLATNLGIATQTARLAFEDQRLVGYVEVQKSVADVLGQPLDVAHGRVPASPPAGQLFVAGRCDGLYISTGERYFPRWLVVERGPGTRHILDVTYEAVDQGRIPLVTVAPSTTVSVEDRDIEGFRWVRFRIDDAGQRTVSRWVGMTPGQVFHLEVVTDSLLRRVMVTMGDEQLVEDRHASSAAPATVHTRAPAVGEAVGSQVRVTRQPTPIPTLCRRLTHEVRSTGAG